jgi:protein gp37
VSRDSKIEWTHHTFNPWWGCTKVSPGCKHCYAETWAKRLGQKVWGSGVDRRELSANYWKQPILWNRDAERSRQRARVFCASMADVFENRRDLDALRLKLWSIIEETPHLDWLLLTKRPHNVARLCRWRTNWPDNVWLGATAENQTWLDRRLPALVASNAKILFLSCEPLLGPLDLSQWLELAKNGKIRRIDWVIGGGESGHNARPMNPEWVRSLRDQCVHFGISFHFKQWGNWKPIQRPNPRFQTKVLRLSTGGEVTVANVGKSMAGRRVDGRTWDEFPCPSSSPSLV